MQQSNTQAIILRRIDYLEHDGIIELFCIKRGKIALIAKGIRKQQSKNKGILRCFSHVECDLFLPKSEGKIGKLIRATPIKPFLRDDIIEQTIFALAAEATSELFNDKDPYPEVFSLWIQFIYQEKASLLSFFWFIFQVYAILGILPSFKICTTSGEKLSPQDYFYWNHNTGIQIRPSENDSNTECKISFSLLKFFNFITTNSIENTEKILLTPLQTEEIWNIVWWFYAEYSKYPPRSKKIFETFWKQS